MGTPWEGGYTASVQAKLSVDGLKELDDGLNVAQEVTNRTWEKKMPHLPHEGLH